MQTSSNAIKSFKKKTQSLVFFLFFITFHLNGHDGHFLPFNRLRLMFEQLREQKRRNLKGVRPKREKSTRKSLRQEVLTHVILKRSFLKETVDVIKREREEELLVLLMMHIKAVRRNVMNLQLCSTALEWK